MPSPIAARFSGTDLYPARRGDGLRGSAGGVEVAGGLVWVGSVGLTGPALVAVQRVFVLRLFQRTSVSGAARARSDREPEPNGD